MVLEKLIVVVIVKISLAFERTRKIISVFTSVGQWILSLITSVYPLF